MHQIIKNIHIIDYMKLDFFEYAINFEFICMSV